MTTKFYFSVDTTRKHPGERHYVETISPDNCNNYIYIQTQNYGIHSPHFYFAISSLTTRHRLTDLMRSEECRKNFGFYFGQDVSQHEYPTHGVNFRLNKPEKIKEFLDYIAPALELTAEIRSDMIQFISFLPLKVKLNQQKQQLAEVERQKQQLQLESKKLQEAIAESLRLMNIEISSPDSRSVASSSASSSASSIAITPALDLHHHTHTQSQSQNLESQSREETNERAVPASAPGSSLQAI